jgi:hypothetical protein
MGTLCLPAPDQPDSDPAADEVNLALLSTELTGIRFSHPSPLNHNQSVAPGHLLKAHFEFGITVGEAAQRMRTFGFAVPDLAPSVEDADDVVLRLLSANLNGKFPWLPADVPVPPGHLIRAHLRLGLDIHTAADWLRSFSLTVVGEDALAEDPEAWLRLVSPGPDSARTLHPARHVSATRILATALRESRPPEEVARKLRTLGFDVRTVAAHERLTCALLSESAAWGWTVDVWGDMSETRSVAPGLLLRAASGCDVTVHDMADRVEALGFARPMVPPQPEKTDTELLRDTLFKEVHPWLEAGSAISLSQVAAAARRTGLPPAAVVERMRLYGLVPPDTPMPSSVQWDDADILEDSSQSTPLSPGHQVPLSHVLRTANELGVSPAAVAERLARYGLTTQDADLPEEVGTIDVRLVDTHDIGLDLGEPVPLYEILHASGRLGLDPEAVAAQVSALGFEIRGCHWTDVDAADARLCQSSEPTIEIYSPLALRDPLPDFVGTVYRDGSEEGAAGLASRLKRLGVDLQRVREAVLAVLPKVPGLVMKPGADTVSATPSSPGTT